MSDWAKIDDSEFQEFAKKVHDAVQAKVMIESIERSLDLVARYALKEVKQRTPVDTGTGRRGWDVTEPHYTGSAFTFDIYNNTEYISFVENGHRQVVGRYVPAIGKRLKKPWVEGTFMWKTTEADLRANMDKIIEPETEKALNQIFGGD